MRFNELWSKMCKCAKKPGVLLGATMLLRKVCKSSVKKWRIPALLGYLRVLKSAPPPSPNVSGLEIETFPSSPPLPLSLGNCLHVHTQGADSTISSPLSSTSPIAKKARTNSRPTPKAFRPSPVKSRAGGRSSRKKEVCFLLPF